MTAYELLRRTRTLLSNPSKWVQGKLRREGGYCLIGALQWSYGQRTYTETWGDGGTYDLAKCDLQHAIRDWYVAKEAARNAEEFGWSEIAAPQNMDIPEFNDEQIEGADGHAEILHVLDKAISRAEGRTDEYKPPSVEELLEK